MSYSYNFEPTEILGVGPTASLQEIRDAYREKSKRYHPDAGGDAWAFRLLAQSYQLLCTARVAGRAAVDHGRASGAAPGPSARPSGPPPHAATIFDRADHAGNGRPVYADAADDRLTLVDVELFAIRYALSDPTELLLGSPESRNLSCNVGVNWPPRDGATPTPTPINPGPTIAALGKAFTSFARKTRAQDHHARETPARFTGWASYPTVAKADAAIRVLRERLHQLGLGVEVWHREMIVPRDSP